MSKLYIIITGTIFDIGGGQIYCRNKLNFLHDQGWDVHIFSYRYGNKILVRELTKFRNNVIRSLKYAPTIFSLHHRKKLLHRILKTLQPSLSNSKLQQIIVESHTIATSLWGEMLARRLNSKHIVYLLYESFGELDTCILDFFDFKHKRRELAGINPKSLQLLFKNYKCLAEGDKFRLNAACTNVVEDTNGSFLENMDMEDIKIGCISRLDKKFVMTLINEIISFAKKYPRRSLTVVIIGDSTKYRTAKRIVAKQKGAKNVKFIMTGPLFPIPRKLFSMIDIFFGVAGGASLPAMEGALTVAVDIETHSAIGFLNRDSNQTFYGENRTKTSISLVLEKVYIQNEIPSINHNFQVGILDYQIEYHKHMDFIKSSSKEKQYYDGQPELIFGLEERLASRLMSAIGLKGFEMLYQLYPKYKRIWNQFLGY